MLNVVGLTALALSTNNMIIYIILPLTGINKWLNDKRNVYAVNGSLID